jgi:hypothetical protein
MNLTEKILAKLKEQYDFILGNIAVVYKDLDWLLDSNVALRRQVEKHTPDVEGLCSTCSHIGINLDDWVITEYPCPFTTEVAHDLGIEAWQNSTNNGTVLPYGILWSANDTR